MSVKTNQNTNTQASGLVPFFILAYAISWLLWLPALLESNGLADLPTWLTSTRQLATFGPGIAAFWLVYRRAGKDGIKRLWKRGWDFSFDKRWLIALFGVPILVIGLTVIIIILTGGVIEWQYGIPLAMVVPVFVLLYLTNALPEEYGWRGFALGRLQLLQNALVASLILGVLHGLWHLPLHFIAGTTQEIMPVWEFFLKTAVGAVIYTWLFNNTGGSVFVAIMYHAFSNTLAGAVPFWTTSQGRWINLGVELVVVVIIIIIFGAKTLARDKDKVVA